MEFIERDVINVLLTSVKSVMASAWVLLGTSTHKEQHFNVMMKSGLSTTEAAEGKSSGTWRFHKRLCVERFTCG